MDEISTQTLDDERSDAARWGDDESVYKPLDSDKTGHFWMLFALLVLAAATLIVLQAGRPVPPSEFQGRALPPLEVAGWLNTDGPLAADDLRGKVVVLNFWATDCPGCVRQLPELASFEKRFRDEGVVVIGLTPESDALGHLTRFLDRVPELRWPVGHGAGVVFALMNAQFTPTYILFDRTGKSTWGGHTIAELEEATIEALAK